MAMATISMSQNPISEPITAAAGGGMADDCCLE